MFIKDNKFGYDVKCPKCSEIMTEFCYETMGRFKHDGKNGWQVLVYCICHNCKLEFFIPIDRENLTNG